MKGSQEQAIRRCAHVIYSGLGGHAAVMFSLLDSGFLKDATHHVVLAGVEPPLESYTDRLARLGITWDYVGKPPRRGHLAFYRDIRQRISAFAPDLVFLNGLAGVPAVLGSRDGAIRRNYMTLLRESEPVQLKSNKEWMILAMAHLGIDRIVHLTPEASDGASEKLGWLHRAGKVSIIPNGIDTEYFSPKAKHPKDDVIRVGMASRLQHKKDHMTLLAAFDQLLSMMPRKRIYLHIAGDGAMKGKIENEVARRGLGKRVVMRGLLDRQSMRGFMRKLDFYVHATFGETMSNSIMQAMATQLPIVASDVNGVANMLSDGCGALYPSEDADALSRQLQCWIERPEVGFEYAQRARARAVREYDIRTIVRRYESLVLGLGR